MKKIAAIVMTGLFLIGTGYVFSRAQIKQSQLKTAKTSEVQEVDLLCRIQVLEEEIQALKKVIEIDGSAVTLKARGPLNISARGPINLESPILNLNGSITTVTRMNVKITFGPQVLRGSTPAGGPATIPLPKDIPAVLTK
jgi:hypothetical protein